MLEFDWNYRGMIHQKNTFLANFCHFFNLL